MAQTHKINQLPGNERNAVIRALRIALTESAEPNYRILNAKLAKDVPGFAELKVSHSSLFRFAKRFVQPAIAKALAKAAEPPKEDTQAVEPTRQAVPSKVVSETEQALTDDPIVSAIVAKRRRISRAIEATFDSAQYDTYAKLEGVDLKALEMHAKAIQHPGFSPAAPQAGNTTNIMVVMPRTDLAGRIVDSTATESD